VILYTYNEFGSVQQSHINWRQFAGSDKNKKLAFRSSDFWNGYSKLETNRQKWSKNPFRNIRLTSANILALNANQSQSGIL
jgi:hypothetical protein